MKDPFTVVAQKAYAEYSRSPEKGYVKNAKRHFCPVCQTTFLYTQVEYHGKSKKHHMSLDFLILHHLDNIQTSEKIKTTTRRSTDI